MINTPYGREALIAMLEAIEARRRGRFQVCPLQELGRVAAPSTR